MSNQKKTIEQFIQESKEKFGDKFDYTLVKYKNSTTKVKIICSAHGIIEVSPTNHLNSKYGCRYCSTEEVHKQQTSSTEQFIEEAKLIHGDKYDYSLVEYKNAKTKVKIICPIHGLFEQKPDVHKKSGCKECGNIEAQKKQTFTKEEFLNKMEKYKDILDFSKAEYVNSYTKVKVHCNICGCDFEKTPNDLAKNGCPKCSNNKRQQTLRNIRYKETLEKINLILNKCNVKLLDKYKGRSEVRGHKWKRYNFKCNKCGYEFIDFFDDQHLQLCPICNPGKISSKGELELRKYIMDNYPQLKILPNDRTILEGKEIDILLPELNIGFEYDGIYWHKDRDEYDKVKDDLAKRKGVIIYHINEARRKQDKLTNFKKVDKIIKTCISSKDI